jgi:hypothetical protein
MICVKAGRVVDLRNIDMRVWKVILHGSNYFTDVILVGVHSVGSVIDTNTKNDPLGICLGVVRREKFMFLEIYKFCPRVGV